MSADTLSFSQTATRLGFDRSTLERHVGTDSDGREVIQLECGNLPIVRIGRARRIPAAQVDFVVTHGHVATPAEIIEFVRAMRGAA